MSNYQEQTTSQTSKNISDGKQSQSPMVFDEPSTKVTSQVNKELPNPEAKENETLSEQSSSANWMLDGTQSPVQVSKEIDNNMVEEQDNLNNADKEAILSHGTKSGKNREGQQDKEDTESNRKSVRENFSAKADPRVQFETFDSSMDDRREEKLVYKFIQRMDYDELHYHLIKTANKFKVTQIFDRSGYSPLHYAAYKNADKMCEILINFVLDGGRGHRLDDAASGSQRTTSIDYSKRKQILIDWINMPSQGEEGFTALHFASFHGNMSLIHLLVSQGADVYAKNNQDINMLHVAAQGDQPVSLAYFLEHKLDINSIDKRNSTPLHWAAFAGAELTLSYIIAWGGDLDSVDTKGLTPLHLAVKSSKDFRSTKSVKQLLIKGSNRNALDFQTLKPIDYISDKSQDEISVELRKLLKEDWSIMGDCLMIRTAFKKQYKTPRTLILYLILMSICFLLLYVSVFQVLFEDKDSEQLVYTDMALFILSMILCIAVACKDPGYLKRDDSIDFLEMLQTFEASSLCPDCKVIRTPRCRHCNLCNRCVDRFDHHCPWVNNCIGNGNYAIFYSFVTCQMLTLLFNTIICCKYFQLEYGDKVMKNQDLQQEDNWHYYRKSCAVFVSLLSCFFLFSVTFLCCVQTGNIIKGETTCERFSKSSQKQLAQHQQDLLQSASQTYDLAIETPKKRMSVIILNDSLNTATQRTCCDNMNIMFCQTESVPQKELLLNTMDRYNRKSTPHSVRSQIVIPQLK